MEVATGGRLRWRRCPLVAAEHTPRSVPLRLDLAGLAAGDGDGDGV